MIDQFGTLNGRHPTKGVATLQAFSLVEVMALAWKLKRSFIHNVYKRVVCDGVDFDTSPADEQGGELQGQALAHISCVGF